MNKIAGLPKSSRACGGKRQSRSTRPQFAAQYRTTTVSIMNLTFFLHFEVPSNEDFEREFDIAL